MTQHVDPVSRSGADAGHPLAGRRQKVGPKLTRQSAARRDAADDAALQPAVRRLVTRMRADGLVLRRDPTDPDSAILVRLGGGSGSTPSRATLGAGRVAWHVVAAAIEAGLLHQGQTKQIEIAAIEAQSPPVRPDHTACEPVDLPDELPCVQPDSRERNLRLAAAAESPLAWLCRRRGADGQPLIDDAAYVAGERLRRDVTLAALLPSVTQNWARADGSASTAGFDPAGASDSTVAARQRVRAVYDVLGARTGDFLIDICAFLMPLQEAERRRGWPARSGKLVLCLALGQLASHYGLAVEARGPERARRARVWRAAPGPASVSELLDRRA